MWRSRMKAMMWLVGAACILGLAATPVLAQTPPRAILYHCYMPGVGFVPVYVASPAAPIVRAAAPEAAPTYGAAQQPGEPNYYTEDNPRAEEEKPDQKLPARIRMRLPANAEVTIDGKKTTSTGSVREFETPVLDPDHVYHYFVQAKWVEDGITVEKSLRVRALSGNRITINFVPPAQERPTPLRIPSTRIVEARELPPVPTSPAAWSAPYP
jgi:uncharacterized protein (TIGR03000 family)